MNIDLEKNSSLVKVKIDGNIDTDGGHKLSSQLQQIMEMDDINHVTFDMTTVKTTTSAGIGKLLNFYKFLKEKNGIMEIKGISDSLFQQFEEIHLDKIFPISKD